MSTTDEDIASARPSGNEGRVPCATREEWAQALRVVSGVLGISRLQVVCTRGPDIAVVASTHADEDSAIALSLRPFCETILSRGTDVLIDNVSKQVPSMGPGVETYAGFPVRWPDRSHFGLLEALHPLPRTFSESEWALLRYVRDGFETDLRCLLADQTRTESPAPADAVSAPPASPSEHPREEFVGDVFDAIGDGLLILDRDGVALRGNRNLQEWLPSHELRSNCPCREIFPGELGEAVEDLTRLVAEGKRGQRRLLALEDAAGRHRWVELSAFPCGAEAEPREAVVVSFRDVTAQRLTERALRASEEKYRAILDGIEDGYYEIDLHGKLKFFNEALGRLLGFLPLELLGMQGLQFLAPRTRLSMRWMLLNALRTGQSATATDCPFLRRDGTEGHLDLSISIMRDSEGHPCGFRGIARDVSHRKENEQIRERLEMQIREAQKFESLGVMAMGIAHDFNNILMGIMGNANLALLETSANSSARECLDEIEQAAYRGAELTAQMVAYSGTGTSNPGDVSLTDMVTRALPMLEAAVSGHGALEFRCGPSLPAVRADETQLQQVLLNLVTNAAEALSDSGGRIEVSTGVMHADARFIAKAHAEPGLPEGRYVYLEVTDTGHGMDASTRARMFDPFFSTKFVGRGLGLAAVQGIVRAHKGLLRVISVPGKGTTVRVCLPTQELQSLRAAGRRAMWESELPPVTEVLVVDDETTIRSVTRRVLERFEISVLTAADGREALDIYRMRWPEIDCVLLDVGMPDMDGREVFLGLREMNPDARIIVASGFTEEDVEQRFLGLGINGLLHKPYSPQELLAALHSAIQA